MQEEVLADISSLLSCVKPFIKRENIYIYIVLFSIKLLLLLLLFHEHRQPTMTIGSFESMPAQKY